MPGVKAVVTGADLVAQDNDFMRDIQENCLAVTKVLYDGHAVAAVAAIDATTAKAALELHQGRPTSNCPMSPTWTTR